MSGSGSAKRRRSESILVRVTPEEKRSIESRSSVVGVTSAEYARRCINSSGDDVDLVSKGLVDLDRQLLAQTSAALGRTGGLIKLALGQPVGVRDVQLRQTMDQVHSAVLILQAEVKGISERMS